VHADTVENVAATVERWLSDSTTRERVRENAGRLARPRAAETIAKRVLDALPAPVARTA